MKRKYVAACGGVLAAAALLLSQATQGARPLSELVPSSPLIYVEARDLGAALRDWNQSPEKAAWLKSDNLKVFSQSRLFSRLSDAQREFAAAAGLAPDMTLLDAVAGSNAALALYDIGALEFLYITRMAEARAFETALWQGRAKFQPRRSANIDYYIRQQQGRRAAFAVTNGLLLIASDEGALASSLALIAGQSAPRMDGEAWYRDAVSAQPQAGELRMVHNFVRVVRTPYFRSYWVQRNTRSLQAFGSFIADLDHAGAAFSERRALLRNDPAVDLRPAEAGVADLAKLAPPDAGLYRAWARPDADSVAALLIEKLVPGRAARTVPNRVAPVAGDIDAVAGTEDDIETRIDEPPLVDEGSIAESQALRKLIGANSPEAVLEVQAAQTGSDGVFVTTPAAIAILGLRPWDATAATGAIEALAAKLWSAGGRVTDLGKPHVAVAGRVLVAGTSQPLVQSMLARTGAAPQGGAAYLARFQHARELPKFERMMTLIDAPSLRTGQGDAREPMFFSENLASLGRVLEHVDNISVVRHDDGRIVRETVVYARPLRR